GNVGTPDERVRTKVRTAAGWTPDDPDVFAHAPGSYAHADGTWALLGHDEQIHPAFLARFGAGAWGPEVTFPPDRDYQYDGSMSARYDPQYEVDCSVSTSCSSTRTRTPVAGSSPTSTTARSGLPAPRAGTRAVGRSSPDDRAVGSAARQREGSAREDRG